MGENGAAAQSVAPAGYDPVQVLGQGRLGRLMLCRDVAGREVAVRILVAQVPADRARPQLESELRAAAAAGSHPCAVQIHRVWADPVHGVCLEQQYCPGGPLAGGVAAQGRSDPSQVVVGALRLAGALARMHAAGLLHRDVRPANVLLDDQGEWTLAEGGVAHALRRATPGARPLHDPRYAPRELLGWEEPGPPADVYALGATVYALLAGQPPATEGTGQRAPAQYAALLAGAAPLPPFVPEPLAALVLRMLAVDPADRPSLTETDQVLRALVPSQRLARVPPPDPPRAVPALPRPRTRIAVTEPDAVERAGRRRILLAVAAVAVLFFAGAGAVVATSGDEGGAPAQLAAAPSLEQPTTAPSAATPTAEPASAPPPAPAATTKSKAKAKAKAKLRGTKGTATDANVLRGLKPRQILAFAYRGRLGVLFDMDSISDQVQRFQFRSARPDGSDSRLGDFQVSTVPSQTIPRRAGYFFEPGVSVNRCVQVRVQLKSGGLVPDGRAVCTSVLTDPLDLRNADEAWESYLLALQKSQQNAATAKPTAATRPTTAARRRNA